MSISLLELGTARMASLLVSLQMTPRGCRYTVEQTCDLLQSLGLQNVSAFQENGITGGDLLELTQEELKADLGLAPLQVQSLDRKTKVSNFHNFLKPDWHELGPQSEVVLTHRQAASCTDVCRQRRSEIW